MASLDQSTKDFIKKLRDEGIITESQKKSENKLKEYNKSQKKTSTPVTTPTAPVSSYTGPSIVDYLSSTGQASDYASRAQLAAAKGISNYTGTAEQNTQLLNTLRGGGSTTTAPSTTYTAPATTPTPSAVSNMTPTDFVKHLVSIGAVKPEDEARSIGIATGGATKDTPFDISQYVPKTDKEIADTEERIRVLKEEAAKPETDAEARDRITALFQREIDALNAAYAQQKIEATKAGLANLGTNRASQARFGLLGSTFGEAETKGIEEETTKKKEAIDVANQAALAPVYNQITQAVMESQKAKQTARVSSLEDYLAQLKSAKETKATIAANAIRNIIVNGAKPSDSDLDKMAKQIGVDPAVFKGDYRTAVKKQEQDSASQYDDLTLSEGQSRFVYNSKTGKYEAVANVPKTYKASNEDDVSNSSFLDIMQEAIDADATPEQAAREAASLSESMGISVTQPQLNSWVSQARNLKKREIKSPTTTEEEEPSWWQKILSRPVNRPVYSKPVASSMDNLLKTMEAQNQATNNFFNNLFNQ
jgi:ribosomal protein S16